MKKFLSSFFTFLLAAELFSAGFESDISVFNELSSAYNSGFYPGCVQYADKLVSVYPESAYAGTALFMKGESLARLGQNDEALDALLEAKNLDSEAEIKKSIDFWLGKVYESKKDYNSAISFYYKYCSEAGENGKLYLSAVFNAGGIYYRQEEYAKAVPNFEYVLKNGKKCTISEFSASLLKLADSYNKSGNAEKTVALYKNFSKDSIPQKVFYALTEYVGDAYALKKDYKKAYEYYCQVLSSGEKSLAANALKKAYNVSSGHKNEVGAEPGNVLKNAQQTLSGSPELVSEFWARLGTDAFKEGDYKKASSYFDEAEKNESPEVFEYIQMYRAEIAAGKNPDVKSAEQAEQKLLAAQKIQSEMENPKYVNDYNTLLAKYSAYQNKWEDVKKYACSADSENERANFYLALANYKTGNYEKTSQILQNSDLELYALSLARQKKLKESAAVYQISEKNGGMSPEERLNYSKVLILSGRYKEAQIQANKCGLNEGKYILGLAQFNTRSWSYAEQSFADFIKNADRKDENQLVEISYAMFYQGYSQYRQGKSKLAYENLAAFIKQYTVHELLWNAQITAANAAVQFGGYADAKKMAEAAVESAKNISDKQESVLLCAEIYADSKDYDKSVEILAPYSALKNEFGLKAVYQTALIYEKKGDYSLADKKFKEAADKFSDEKLAEEAMYRRAELFYKTEDYSSALERFNEYKNRFKNGQFIDASWYYAADCMAKTGNVSGAILQNQALVKKMPESTYVYGAAKNLIELCRSEEKYSDALQYANFLLQKFGGQAKSDGIAQTAEELEKLAGGKDEVVVKKEAEYKNLGGSNTPEGRKAGTELVVLYAKNPETSKNAVLLARQLLELQEKFNRNDSETRYAAQNADIVAQSLRNEQKNKQSADLFLRAAKYYRISGENENAAATMYGAYDAFLAAGMKADANATAKQLNELYPSSRQAKSARTDN